jgi:hypothetical protein
MLTVSDFMTRVDAIISDYPDIEARYRAGDPVIKMQLQAVATMLAMQSAEQEVTAAEPFEKTRDVTVLADAAIKGLLPMAKPAVFSVSVTNTGSTGHTLATGRTLIDSAGRYCSVVDPVTIAAGATATCQVRQVAIEASTTTVTDGSAFYEIEVPSSADDAALCSVDVLVNGDRFEYRPRFVNTNPGDQVFTLEVNIDRQVLVRFGMAGVVGYQPQPGDEITINAGYCFGSVEPEYQSPFQLLYQQYPEDAYLTMAMDTIVTDGMNSMSISQLRELAKYPAVYDQNAVFLGEFDRMLRLAFPGVQFLSVWSEKLEEVVRGPSVTNMNCLFVACYFGASEAVQYETTTDLAPNLIAAANLTANQLALQQAILDADDSYRVRFYTPVIRTLAITVAAVVPTSFVATEVRSQIIAALVDAYGMASTAAKRGGMKPSNRGVSRLLESSVAALAVDGADYSVTVPDIAETVRPELWRYVDESSVTVTVVTRNSSREVWS